MQTTNGKWSSGWQTLFTFFTLKPQRKGSLMTGPFPINSPTTEQPTVENVLVDK